MSSSVGKTSLGTVSPGEKSWKSKATDDEFGGGADGRRLGFAGIEAAGNQCQLVPGHCQSRRTGIGLDVDIKNGGGANGSPVTTEFQSQQPAAPVRQTLQGNEAVQVGAQ